MDYFNYKINKDNVLFDANPKDVVQFKILYDMEHKYWFSKFHDHIFEKIIVLDNIIEFYIIDRKDKVKLSNWYQMEDVYPFLYEIVDGIMILTRIHYVGENHLLKPLGDFKYYSLELLPSKDCFCSQYHIIENDVNLGEYHHNDHMKSTQGHVYNHCTLYTLYNSNGVSQVCSDCSLFKQGEKVYSLYTSTYPDVSNIFEECISTNICQDVIEKILKYNEPKYNQVALYEHVLVGDEPGYCSNGGNLDLELISYKMGVKVMSDLIVYDSKTNEKIIHKPGKTIFDYIFNYKTSKINIGYMRNEKEGRLYLHRGSVVLRTTEPLYNPGRTPFGHRSVRNIIHELYLVI